MPHALRPRRLSLTGASHLDLVVDPQRPTRYLVRFCGLNRDRAALAATESARVRLMMASLRGEAAFPRPLPERITIGWLDHTGWHAGRSPLARALASMECIRDRMAELDNDLMLRVALIAAEREASAERPPDGDDAS